MCTVRCLHKMRPAAPLLAIREVGGAMLPLWHVYYSECSALVYVVDAADAAALTQAAVELFEMLEHADLAVSGATQFACTHRGAAGRYGARAAARGLQAAR